MIEDLASLFLELYRDHHDNDFTPPSESFFEDLEDLLGNDTSVDNIAEALEELGLDAGDFETDFLEALSTELETL